VRKKSNNKIPFGLKNDTLVEVSEVESGLACGCICPSCKRKLQANKGQHVSHYFSHDPSVETKVCESAFETSIHLMAKEILCEDGYLIFPALTISFSKSDQLGDTHVEEMLIEEEGRRSFERVELEKRLEEIRPDIIAYINGEPFLIEVAVTSFADSNKKKIIRNLGLPAIEIDLSSVDYTTTKNDLRELINGSSAKKQWLFNPKAMNAPMELLAKLGEKIQRINESIDASRRKLQKQPNPPIRQAPNTEDVRFFVCEACRHLFEVPRRNAPDSIETIPCPECDHAVSTKPWWAFR
jgi:hypothetical protein